LGLARWIDAGDVTQLTQARSILGTPKYMAPEQIAEPSAVGPPADLWALGAIIFELLTGHAPFEGDGDAVIEEKRKGVTPVIIGEGELERLARTLLSPDPLARLTGDEIVAALDFEEPDPA